MKNFGCLFLIIGPCALLVGLTTYNALGWTIAGVILIALGIWGTVSSFLSS